VKRFIRGALLLMAAIAIAGCGFGAMAQRPVDYLSTWSLTPLPPDPELAALAIGPTGTCRLDDGADDVPGPAPGILVQDRRTRDTAAFLLLSPQHFGDCLLTRGAGSGSGFGPVLGAMEGQLTIESRSSGTVANGTADVLGGRIAIAGARVIVELHDGRQILASTANGYWLTWRPSVNGAKRVVALSPEGVELASIDVPVD
jgi:hypothetical protein